MKCISLSLFQCYLTRKSVAAPAPAPPQHISDDATSEEDGIDTQFPLITDIVDATLKNGRFQIFRYSELRQATNGFSRHLGRGGFGSVYYGKLQDGREVAIKRYHKLVDKTLEQFLNEIKLSSPLSHPNLVSFYGYSCCLSHKPLLVYEYVSNGTLSSHVHGIKKEERRTLPWSTRLKISIETASALAYLHDSGVIHRDVKSSNILLDENLSAKVADFGLLHSLPLVGSGYGTHVSTAPQGTHGYMDPDYWQLQRVSDKSDVYSFGVLLCELISSRQALHTERIDGDDFYLATFAASKIQEEELHQLVDPSLGFDSDNEIRHTITVVAELAFLCLQCPKDLRPSMKQVLETLEGIREGIWGFYQIT